MAKIKLLNISKEEFKKLPPKEKKQQYNKRYREKTKQGKVNKVITKTGAISARIESILKDIEDVNEKEFIKAKIRQYSSEMQENERSKKAMTLATFKTMYEAERVQIFLDNMGVDMIDLLENLAAKGIIVSEEDVLNNANWDWKGNRGSTGTVGATLRLQGYLIYFVFEYYSHSYEVQVLGTTTIEDVEDWT